MPERRPEKGGSWTLPGIPPYASRTVPAMLLACSTRYLRARFWLYFGSILGAFWGPWAPKSRPGSEKEASKKGSKKHHPHCGECPPKTEVHPFKSRDFLASFWGLDAIGPPTPPLAPKNTRRATQNRIKTHKLTQSHTKHSLELWKPKVPNPQKNERSVLFLITFVGRFDGRVQAICPVLPPLGPRNDYTTSLEVTVSYRTSL